MELSDAHGHAPDGFDCQSLERCRELGSDCASKPIFVVVSTPRLERLGDWEGSGTSGLSGKRPSAGVERFDTNGVDQLPGAGGVARDAMAAGPSSMSREMNTEP